MRQFCRKLLGYALGRAVQLSDEPLLAEMQTELKANDYVGSAVEAIVRSRQFREIRGRETAVRRLNAIRRVGRAGTSNAKRSHACMKSYEQHQFSRRTMLRGLGVTMALPWLESLPVWGDEPAGKQPSSEAPVRLAVLFSGNGFHSKEWWAKGEGKSMELGQVLAPLSDFREKMLFIRGLYNEQALKGNIHSSQTGNLLSGAPLASGGEIRSGTSVDQLLAQSYGRSTKVPSLVLGCEKSNPSVHKNYSMLYSSHISWSSPTTPTPLELYPALAFDRLFKDEVQRGDKSVLDAVLADAKRSAPPDQHHRPAQARRISRLGARRRTAHRKRRQAGRAARLAADARQAQHPPPARRHSPEHRRPHAADVRHPGARLPDRHHADHHAQAEQRPLVAPLSRTWAWTT